MCLTCYSDPLTCIAPEAPCLVISRTSKSFAVTISEKQKPKEYWSKKYYAFPTLEEYNILSYSFCLLNCLASCLAVTNQHLH